MNREKWKSVGYAIMWFGAFIYAGAMVEESIDGVFEL